MTADPEVPVPPVHYGGIERIIDLLVRALVQRRHEVTLVAHPASQVPCALVPYASTRSAGVDVVRHARLIASTTSRTHPDVIHSFGRLASLALVLPRRTAKVMSYQREVTLRTVRMALRLARGSLSFAACSRRMIQDVEQYGRWRVVHNGVDVARYEVRPSVAPDAPLVFLGRIERIKGTHLAIEVARRAGRRLIIAGNVAPDHTRYFEEHVRPGVDGDRVTYTGPVDDRQKSELLGGAAALLMPILWEEPFGIVMAEALACGTPVIALDRGAVPEVIEDRRTGFVCGGVDEMVDAVGRLAGIDRLACRHAAEARFSQDALADAYEALYLEEVEGAVGRRPGGAPARAADDPLQRPVR